MNNEMMYNLLRAGKIKGHTRIILEDTKGHRIIKEDHNMVTNALAKIFESNYHGIVDFHAFDQAPPSLGFSRQEHWSGLPFPPPMHENEK